MFYRIARLVLAIYYRLFYRMEIIGQENIPRQGGCILCANHTSVKDPMALAIMVKRSIHFIAKQELKSNKLFGLVLTWLNTVPVDRQNVNMSTFKMVLDKLKEGKCIGIFAQGTRIKEIEAKDAKAGVALFAVKGNVPVVPICISSTYKHFSKIYIHVGKPMSMEEYQGKKIKSAQLNEITEKVMANIMALHIPC